MFTKAIPYLLCAFAGLFATGSFLPFGFWWLMPTSLIVLFYYWNESEPIKCLWLGFVFGVGFYGSGMHWIFVLAYNFNQASLHFSLIVCILVCCIFTSYVALIGYIQSRFFKGSYLIIPSLWVISEWFRGSGLPWLDLGYSQTTHLLSNYAPIGGVHLVTFILVLVCVLIVKINDRKALFKKRANLKSIAILFAIIITPLLLSTSKNNTKHELPQLSVAIVQLNLPIKKKWDNSYLNSVLNQYQSTSKNLKYDLIIWPETAIPTDINQIKKSYWFNSKHNRAELISGVKEFQEKKIHNSAIVTCNNELLLYRKNKLVPFGEYIPSPKINRPLFKAFGYTLNEFSSWQDYQPTKCDGKYNLALSICFEIAFPDFIRRNLKDSEFLVNISEDGWFNNHLGNYHRLQMAQMRALELHKPMLASSNTGPSAIIDKNGKIIKFAKDDQSVIINGHITPNKIITPFARYGAWIYYVAIFIILFNLIKNIFITYRQK